MNTFLWISLILLSISLIFYKEKRLWTGNVFTAVFASILTVEGLAVVLLAYLLKSDIISFPQEGVLKTHFFDVPTEISMFGVALQFAFLTSFEFIKIRFKEFRPIRFSYIFSLIVSISMLVFAFTHHSYDFTFYTFVCVGLLNWVVYFAYTPKWYPYFLILFFVLAMPILLSLNLFADNASLFNKGKVIRVLGTPLEALALTFSGLLVACIVYESVLSFLRRISSK